MTPIPHEPTAEDLIELLGLVPHPEGGHYRETFRDQVLGPGGRSVSTAIYFLLRAGEVSRWHRVDASETWHFYRGAALELSLWDGRSQPRHHRLGAAVERAEQPQIVVPANVWQRARCLGEYTLVGCTVAPGFDFAGFEIGGSSFGPGEDRWPSPLMLSTGIRIGKTLQLIDFQGPVRPAV